jgi:hypothetical protein
MPRIETGENPQTGLGGLANLKALKVRRIDAETSAAILAGFDYEVAGQSLHFSYDAFDQQNFADAANNALAALMAGQPFTVAWNAYDSAGALNSLELDAGQFLALYQQGACTHKVTQMGIARLRKTALAEAATAKDVDAA